MHHSARPFRTCVGVLLVVFAAVSALPGHDAVLAQQTPAPVWLTTPDQLRGYELAAARNLSYLPGEVIVKFRPGVSVGTQAQVLSVLRTRPSVDRLHWIGDRTARLSTPEDLDAVAVAASLARQPEVEYAQPNWLLKKQLQPNDPGFAARQWNLTALDMPRAWDINAGAAGIVIAVIDTGITTTTATHAFKTWNGSAIVTVPMAFRVNPDMSAERFVSARDFVFWSGPPLDMDGHGTHIGGTIAQTTNNGIGYAGIAFNASIMPLKVCLSFWDFQILRSSAGIPGFPSLDSGDCPNSAVVQAIRYAADNGAHVINFSIGGVDPSPATLDAINYAVSRGVFVAMAAGNEFEDGNPTTYPASYGPQVAGAMAVGAVGRSLTHASYSTTGTFVEIVAPGGDFDDGGLNGVIWQSGINFDDYDPEVVIFPRFDRYADAASQGTSMATPHVAGLAALLIKQGVTKPAAIEDLIRRSARDLGAAGKDNEFGYGLIQPRAALRGFGLVK